MRASLGFASWGPGAAIRHGRLAAFAVGCLVAAACGSGEVPTGTADAASGSGGAPGSGGNQVSPGSGGAAMPGSGGAAGTGVTGSGGAGSGGAGSGGAGGAGSGGAGTGGRGTGGASAGTGGGGSGGAGTGGRGSGGAAGTGGRGSGGAGGRAGTLRIMPLGDSTTGSVCWRANLWQMLNQAGHTGRFAVVGTRRNDAGCGVSGYDQDNEGHPSVLVTNFVDDADDQVAGVQTPRELLGRNPADVVLLHFATNDIWNEGSVPLPEIFTAYATVLAALRQANPNVVVMAAQLIPMAVTASTCAGCSCAGCPTRINSFNSMLAGSGGWAATNSTAASPIVVVDQFTGFNAAAGSDTTDGVHPNASGSMKIATRWNQALAPYF